MAFLPQNFISNIKAKDGPARPSRFEVVIPIPRYINQFVGNSVLEQIINFPNSIISDVTSFIRGKTGDEQSQTDNGSLSRYLALQCDTAELPGRQLATADAKIYGPIYKVPYQTLYGDINLSFICTNEFYERKLFDRWIEAIMPSDTNNLRFPKEESSRYMTNIKIIQYDEFIRQIYAIELIDAYPIAIAGQPLSWSEEGFHRLNVQFAYQKYRVVYQGNYDLVGAALEIFGSKANDWFKVVPNTISGAAGTIFNVLT